VRARFNTQAGESWLDDRYWCGDWPSMCGDDCMQKTQICGIRPRQANLFSRHPSLSMAINWSASTMRTPQTTPLA
jgi:hypothetical protein